MSWTSFIPRSQVVAVKGDDRPVTALTDHSEKVTSGALYFAIKGATFDGHTKAAAALSKGAAYAVVEDRGIYDTLDRAILVKRTRETWGHAVANRFQNPSRDLSLVGVTGTNGKTTTTYLLVQSWEALGLKTGLIGTVECRLGGRSFESQLTTPGAWELQSMFGEMRDAKVTHAAMEVSSIALDQFRTAGTRFTVGVFTNFTRDHLDYHGDFEAYWAAKARLFEEYDLETAVVNADDPQSMKIRKRFPKRVWSFGLGADADFRAEAVELHRDHTTARLVTPEGERTLRLSLLGGHNVSNALTVIAANFALGISVEKSVEALATASGAPGRLERVELFGKGPSVFVDYAHTPDALDNVLRALDVLRAGHGGRLITVFGCGGDRDRTKRPLTGAVAQKKSDLVVVTSDNPRTENPDTILQEIASGISAGSPNVHFEVDRRKGIALALSLARPEDWVLIAGKGHENYQILGTTKIAFDDRQVVREYYGLLTQPPQK